MKTILIPALLSAFTVMGCDDPPSRKEPSVAQAPPPPSPEPSPSQPSASLKILTKSERLTILEEMKAIEKRNRAASRSDQAACMKRMADDFEAIRAIQTRLKGQPLPGGIIVLQHATSDLMGCSDCSKDYMRGCDGAKALLKEAGDEIRTSN